MRLVGFFSSRCERYAFRRRTLPVPVMLEALGGAAVRLHLRHHVAPLSCGGGTSSTLTSTMGTVGTCSVFWGSVFWGSVLGLGSGARAGARVWGSVGLRGSLGLFFLPVFLGWVQHHGHVAAVLAGLRLDHREIGDVLGDTVQDLHAELRVGHLATAEHDRELDLVAFAEEAHHVLHLGGVVVLVDLGPELHLLDDDVRGLALRLPAPLFLLVDVPAVVHDPADRRVGVGRDLDQVELLLTGLGQRFREGLDAELFALGTDEEHLAGSDAVVDPDLVCSYLVTCFIGA